MDQIETMKVALQAAAVKVVTVKRAALEDKKRQDVELTTKIETAQRESQRHKKRVRELTGGTVSENIEGVMNAAMKQSSKKRKT